MRRTTPPFRADHVGSLLRPRALLEAREDLADGPHRRRTSCAQIEDEAIRDVVRMQEDAGLPVRHRRRVPPRVVAHGLHLPARRRRARPATTSMHVHFHNARGRDRLHAGRAAGRREDRGSSEPIFGDDFAFLQGRRRRRAHAEADDPVAEHGPLPRRARPRSTRDVYPDLDEFWERPHRGVRRAGRGWSHELGCTLPAARRHQPRLPERPEAARDDGASSGEDAEHQHEPYIRHINAALADRPDGHGRHHAHVPRQLPLVVGGRGRLRLRRRGAVQRARRSTASSWSTTTRARAASSRCASCPRARWSCSGW